ncbi:hypothetical protein D3C80_1471740 [compost metagenome]
MANRLRLSGEVHSTELVSLQHAELATWYQWRRNHDQAGGVARLCRVIPNPDLPVSEGPGSKRLVVRPDRPTVHHARLQHVQREDARAVVDKLTHQQILERRRVVLEPQFVDIEQIAAPLLRVHDGDDLPRLSRTRLRPTLELVPQWLVIVLTFLASAISAEKRAPRANTKIAVV